MMTSKNLGRKGGERVIERLHREWELIGPMMIRVFVVY
jgi:hypothetical protein